MSKANELSAATSSKLAEMRKERDLKEARKSGLVPPERDATGKPINPHIPDFMAKAPWYLTAGEQQPGLAHHKAQNRLLEQFDHSADKLKDRYQRGKAGPAATRYRAGACTNCGAMTHSAKECLERPRKLGAKWTGKDIAADEIVLRDRRENYDSKRDRWDGYDPASHHTLVEEHEAMEATRQKMREEALDKTTDMGAVKKVAKAGKAKKPEDDEFGSSDDSDEEDDEKYADAADQAGAKLDTNNRISVRNLRIREDTAKYLRDLQSDTAHYDPKSRSMRDAPDVNADDRDPNDFAGDAFTRGEAADAKAQQLFAWQASQRGQNLDMHANPTQAALVHRQFLEKKAELKGQNAQGMLDKYGGKEYLQKAPKELLEGQTENYVEYSRTGQIIKGQERAKAKSKYDEDVFPGNHASVWGSYYKSGQWGYACCHAFLRQAYCAGQAGIDAEREEAAGRLLTGTASAFSAPDQVSLHSDQHNADIKGKRKADEANDAKEGPASKRRVGEGDVDKRIHPDRLRAAMEAERTSRRNQSDDRSRPFNGADHIDVTEEDIEAYRRMRDQFDDPMAKLADGELLPLN